MSPFDNVGAFLVSIQALKMRPFIGALTIHGAVKPAMKVCVFHEPNGAWELKRRPLADHPVHLVSLV